MLCDSCSIASSEIGEQFFKDFTLPKVFAVLISHCQKSCTLRNVSRHPRPVMPVEVLTGTDEHIICVGFSKRDFLRGHIIHLSLFGYVRAYDTASSGCIYGPILAGLPDRGQLITQPVFSFTTFKTDIHPARISCRYNRSANRV